MAQKQERDPQHDGEEINDSHHVSARNESRRNLVREKNFMKEIYQRIRMNVHI